GHDEDHDGDPYPPVVQPLSLDAGDEAGDHEHREGDVHRTHGCAVERDELGDLLAVHTQPSNPVHHEHGHAVATQEREDPEDVQREPVAVHSAGAYRLTCVRAGASGQV